MLVIKKAVFRNLLKSRIAGFTRKNGTYVAEHNDSRIPKPGDTGHHEHTTYGVYFRKGDKVKDNYGNHHEVLRHNGAQVTTTKGEHFHPTKLYHIKKE